MQDTQDLILRHNFIQQLPKCIADRFTDTDDAKEKFKQGLKNGGKFNPLQDKKRWERPCNKQREGLPHEAY